MKLQKLEDNILYYLFLNDIFVQSGSMTEEDFTTKINKVLDVHFTKKDKSIMNTFVRDRQDLIHKNAEKAIKVLVRGVM